MPAYIRPFSALSASDVPLVGGKTASLGELQRLLASSEITVPAGFAITAAAYRDALTEARAWPKLHALLDGLDPADLDALASAAAAARETVYEAIGGAELARQIDDGYRALLDAAGGDVLFCRSTEEAERVLAALAEHGLGRGQDGLEIYVMCEILNNVVQIDAFAQLFDGVSIGSNDLTQLVLGVDRDSEVVAFDFDERDLGVQEMLRQAVDGARRNGRHVGISGEAPATYPEVAAFLVRQGIGSISVNPQSLARTLAVVAEAERGLEPAARLARA